MQLVAGRHLPAEVEASAQVSYGLTARCPMRILLANQALDLLGD